MSDNESRKGKKRKHSSSYSYSYSYSYSDDSRDKKHKHKDKSKSKHKDKDKSKSKHKEKDKRKSKHKSKSKSKHKKAKKEKSVSSLKAPKEPLPVTNPISEDDYFTRATEFRIWLKEDKGKTFIDLTSDEQREYFRKFVKVWNDGRLNEQYYRGLQNTEHDLQSRSKSAWKFNLGEKERWELDSMRDNVDSLTNKKTFAEKGGAVREIGAGAAPPRVSGPTMPARGPVGPTMPSVADEIEMEQASRKMHRDDVRSFRRDEKERLEEMLPRATGRDAMIEKRRATAEKIHGKRGGDVSPELGGEFDVMGGDMSRSSSNPRQTIREARAQQEKNQRLADYQAKEKATMDAFRKSMGLS